MVATSGKGWKLAPSLLALIRQLDAAYPNRDTRSDGSIGNAEHAARESDHNPYQGWVHAVDIDEDIAPGLDLKGFAADLERSRDSRVRYVIYEGRILKAYASNGQPAWTWHRYDGPNAHATHLHASINRTAQARDDLRPWPLNHEDDMTPEQSSKLDRILAETDKLYTGETITRIADAVILRLPKTAGGQGLTFEQTVDAVKEALREGTG